MINNSARNLFQYLLQFIKKLYKNHATKTGQNNRFYCLKSGTKIMYGCIAN